MAPPFTPPLAPPICQNFLSGFTTQRWRRPVGQTPGFHNSLLWRVATCKSTNQWKLVIAPPVGGFENCTSLYCRFDQFGPMCVTDLRLRVGDVPGLQKETLLWRLSLRVVFIYTKAQKLSVYITRGLVVAAEEIWPHDVFLDKPRFPQTPSQFPVALAQQRFTFVFQIICKHKEIVEVEHKGHL